MRSTLNVVCGLTLWLGAAAPTLAQTPKSASPDSAVIAAERAAWELLKQRKWDAFDAALVGETLVDASGISIARPGSAKTLAGLVTRSYTLDSVRVRTVTPDVVIVTYKAAVDQTFDGKRTPSPLYMLSVWHKQGGKWRPVAHTETQAADAR